MASPSQIQGDENPIPKVIEKGTPKVKPQLHPISFKSSFLTAGTSILGGKILFPFSIFVKMIMYIF